jgi:hypothetical protein
MEYHNYDERNDFAGKMIDTAISTALTILIEEAVRFIIRKLIHKEEKHNY